MEISASDAVYNLVTNIADNIIELDKGLEQRQYFPVVSANSKQTLAGFYLEPLPGCCGVVVSTGSWIIPEYRGSFGKLFHTLKETVARKLGYSLMLATTELRNLPEVIGASNAKWKHIHTFRNQRTSHDLSLMIKDLT